MKIKPEPILILLFIAFHYHCQGIIIRDDVSDSKYIELGKKYSDILCHFPMGEGTLIDSSWVITAGHIGNDLKRDLENGLNVSAKINGASYDIEEVFIHPDFQPIIHDLALVKLKTKVISNRYVKLNKEPNESGLQITIFGMGDVGNGLTGPQKWDKITRAATNKIDGVDNNWIWFKFDDPSSSNVTEMEGISGPGDSGGPALIETNNGLTIIGISSNQKTGSNNKGTYGVTEYYTRLSTYYNWINNILLGEKIHPTLISKTESKESTGIKNLSQFTGNYGFRKIIMKNNSLFFQRENEPLIPMAETGKDLFLWDDNNTQLQFQRNKNNDITGFEIQRKNGEVVKVSRDK